MAIRWRLKEALVEEFGSQVEAAERLEWREGRLSYLVRGHAQPSDQERADLEMIFGESLVETLLSENYK